MDAVFLELMRGGGLIAFAWFFAWQNHGLINRVIKALEDNAANNGMLASEIKDALREVRDARR